MVLNFKAKSMINLSDIMKNKGLLPIEILNQNFKISNLKSIFKPIGKLSHFFPKTRVAFDLRTADPTLYFEHF